MSPWRRPGQGKWGSPRSERPLFLRAPGAEQDRFPPAKHRPMALLPSIPASFPCFSRGGSKLPRVTGEGLPTSTSCCPKGSVFLCPPACLLSQKPRGGSRGRAWGGKGGGCQPIPALMLVLSQSPTETRRRPSTPVSSNQHLLPGPRTAPSAPPPPPRESTKKGGAAKGCSLLSPPVKVEECEWGGES